MKKFKSIVTVILVLVLIGIVSPEAFAGEKTVVPADVETPSEGCFFLELEGTYYSDAQAALDRMNQIRYEACTDGTTPDPRDPSRMLTEDDYVPIRWSSDLEAIARVRAYESALTISHARLNGKSWSSVSSNGYGTSGECLAWNYNRTMVSGIEQWYRERTDWVNRNSSAVTGHYTAMIDPGNTYVGLGDFYSTQAYYKNTVCGEFNRWTSDEIDQTMRGTEGLSDIIQLVEADADSSIMNYSLSEEDFYVDEDTEITLQTRIASGSHLSGLLNVHGEITFTSGNESIAVVSGHTVTGVSAGEVVLTAYCGAVKIADFTITVQNCNHVPGDSGSITNGVYTGVCAKCGAEITFNVPTSMTMYRAYKEDGSTSGYSLPSSVSIEEGSELSIWLYSLGGSADSDHDDVLVEMGTPGILTGTNRINAGNGMNGIYDYEAVGAGVTTVRFYCEYNPEVSRTISVTVNHVLGEGVTTAPTCTEDGYTTYTCTVCGESIRGDETEALGHAYGAPSYTWTETEDGYTCTATETCTRDSSHVNTETVTAAYRVTAAPGCLTEGEGTYTVAFSDHDFSSQTRRVTVDPVGHSWGAPVYSWTRTDDGYTCTASETCSRNSGHVNTESAAAVYEVLTEPGCETEGEGVYTASFSDADFSAQTRNETIPAVGHDYDHGICRVCGDGLDGFELDDGSWVYYLDGEPQSSLTGAVNGTIDRTEAWYCIENGVYDASFTGMVQKADGSDAVWFYAQNGVCSEIDLEQNVNIVIGSTCNLTTLDGVGDTYRGWISDSEETVSVNSSGRVTVKGFGNAVITGFTSDRQHAARITVHTLFTDVTDPSVFYFDYVYWGADLGITTGWDDGTFRPQIACNRATVVTFLWRLAGCPEPTAQAAFSDMTGNPTFDRAISWAVETGITTGWSDGTFRPWKTCNRATIVTFLWRYAGKPDPLTGNETAFSDMTSNDDFNAAIAWAASCGITTGWNDGTFRPWNDCNRLSIMSFLARYAQISGQ